MYEGYVYINSTVFPTLLAISGQDQQHGLMNIEWPPPVMSFVYSSPRVNKFWMKNTPSPLDIVFCCNGKVSQICIGEPFSTTTIGDDEGSDLVIEFPYGTVTASGIRLGHKVGIIKPTENELKEILAQSINY